MKHILPALFLVCLVTALSGQTFRQFPTGSGAGLFAPVIADFNGDSLPDVIGNDFVIFGGARGVRLLLNTTTDSLTFSNEGYIGNFLPAGIPGTGDFDGDGDMDFIIAEEGEEDIFLFQNDGAANFTPVGLGVSGITVLTAGDFNGDGLLDFAGYKPNDAGGFSVFLNGGSNNFVRKEYFGSFNSITDFFVFDANGDGRDDIGASRETLDFGVNSTLIFLSDAQGNPVEGAGVHRNLSDRGLFADINNDGLTDIIIAERNALYPFLADGNGGYTDIGFIQFGFRNLRNIKIADFDGDNRNDVLIASRDDGMQYYRRTESDDVYEFEQNNIGDLSQPISIAVEDMDGDGDLDFVASSTIAYWFENIIPQVPPVSVTTYQQLARPAFPNPVRDVLYLPGLEGNSNMVTIYDMNGRLMRTRRLVGGNVRVTDLPTGAYQLLVRTDAGVIAVRFLKVE